MPAATLVELLQDRSDGPCSDRGFTFFRGDDVDDQWLRYSQLHEAAQAIAVEILALSQRPSPPPRVVILCPPGPTYLKALLGSIYAGMIAVTAYPPRARRRDARLDAVIEDSGASVALVDQTIFDRRDQILKSSPSLKAIPWINADAVAMENATRWQPPPNDPDATAVLQYTSGSTSDPKGVQLTHRNLMSNLRMIYDSFEVQRYDDKWSVTWLPPYHDMGLIGGLLQVMYAGECCHVLPPASFVQKPIRWLRAISKYRASVSGGPNFAFDACVDRIDRDARDELDLSSWTLAFTGAEPIRARSLERFADAFGPCGFQRSSFFPCYGLAEATLMVTGGPRRRDLRCSEGPSDSADTLVHTAELVSCGRAVSGAEVRIVDPKTLCPVATGTAGEIWVSSDSVSPGYWNNEQASREAFGHRLSGETSSFLRTGDLGYQDDGELYVSGRIKEQIIVRGRNFQPSDLEAVVADGVPACVPNACAAFEIDAAGQSGLAIALEVERHDDEERQAIVGQVNQCLVDAFELQPARVILLSKRALPKTSSGKVKRLETRRLYGQGELDALQVISASPDRPPDPPSQIESQATVPSLPAAQISQWLVARLAKQLHVDESSIDVERPFVQYGLDSVSAVQIASELESHLARKLPATLLYEAPTIAAVSRKLGDRPKSDVARMPRWLHETRDPSVAIVGVACRLPGCNDIDDFWRLLRHGQTAISQPSPQRRDCVSESAATQRAGWIEDVDCFDASLFNISPREARWIDPQHRLVLETSWRAIENAGIDPKKLAGSRTAAYVGISNRDYERLILRHQAMPSTYAMTGNAASMAAHRLSYHLDLHGPSAAIDTACSSSLVAVHQAVRAIQSGDCRAALVAGVNLILSPEVSDTLSDAEMLSPSGLCKTFDASADGYVRGEGCVAMLLKPLGDAIADGDSILSVICGSAINQDGQTNGITAPNGDSQARLYRLALQDARIDASEVTLLEAHGTGTALGDPIEVSSLCEVYGMGSGSNHRCHLGALKANIGHLEAAAGLASLLKVILQLQHRESVGQPNLRRFNPHIDLSNSRIEIPTDVIEWQEPGPRIAAVSSFGFGGTNAHVVVAERPADAPGASNTAERVPVSRSDGPFLVTLSAIDPPSLKDVAAAHARAIDAEENVGAIADATHQQKTSHRCRLAVVGETKEMLGNRLRQFALDETSPAIQSGRVPGDRTPKIALMFSGHGGQYVGMGRQLYERCPAFRDSVDRCDQWLDQELGYRVSEAIKAPPETNGAVARILNGPGAHLALFVLQHALTRTLDRWGIRSHAVMGHGVGEYAAAVASNVMDWQDALRLLDPAAESRQRVLPGISLRSPNQVFMSTVAGVVAADELQSNKYWTTRTQQQVRFDGWLQTLASVEPDLVIEIGPQSTLCEQAEGNHDVKLTCRPWLQHDLSAWEATLRTLADLYVRGVTIDWQHVDKTAASRPRIILPGHPFRRKRFWINTTTDEASRAAPKTDSPTTRHVIEEVQARRGTADASEATPVTADQLAGYAEAMTAIDHIAAGYMITALRDLGILLEPGQRVDPADLVRRGIVAFEHERLLTRICETLEDDAILRRLRDQNRSPQWIVVRSDHRDDGSIGGPPIDLARQELSLVRRCGASLAQVLRGEIDPLGVLFPGGDTSELEKLYRDSPLARCSNGLVAEVAAAFILRLSRQSDARPRVLEIGAGTGGTTSQVLAAIGDQIQSYRFTDTSPLLLADSATRFGSGGAVQYQKLDIEHTPESQGIDERSFDLVIAANVLHATRDLRASISNARRCLRDGGMLVLLESVRGERFLDLVFGLTEGWWRFADWDLRPNYPLLNESQWITLLAESGFDSPTSVPFQAAHQSAEQAQSVLIATRRDGEYETRRHPLHAASSDSGSLGQANNLGVTTAPIASQWIDDFQQSSSGDRPAALARYFRQLLSVVAGIDPTELDLDQPVGNLGIDSLMAIQLKNRLESDLELTVPMVAFLEGKSIRQIIDIALDDKAVSGSLSGRSFPPLDGAPLEVNEPAPAQSDAPGRQLPEPDDLVAPRPRSISSSFSTQDVDRPLSAGQLALWLIHRRAPESSAYNFAFAAKSSQPIDLTALTKACRTLIKRHPELRTRFRYDGSAPSRTVESSSDVSILEKDCRDWDEPQLTQWIRDEADRPFDLQQGPVIRFALLRWRSSDVLSIAMHHIAADLWSMDLLIQEMIDLYAVFESGGAIELGPLPKSYDDYVAWENQLERTEEGARLWSYWQQKLKGAPQTLALPTSYPRPPQQTFDGESIEWSLPAEVVEDLRQLAQSERTTLFTILLAAYQVFLVRICNQDDVLVGTVAASRGRPEWEGIVGYFLNHLVLRTRIKGSPAFRDVLRDSQREVLDALENQAFPFARLVQKLSPIRDPSRSPLVQTMFIWDKPRQFKESHFAHGDCPDRLRLKPLLMEQRGAPFDLTLIVFELEDELKLTFRYNTDLFSREAVESLAESFGAMITAVAGDPDTSVRSVPIVSAIQQRTIARWNTTDLKFDPDLSVDAMLRRYAQSSPDAPALESTEETLTYSQVDARAAEICRQLRGHEIGKGDVVAVLMPRSVDAVVAILGIWKAGAVYLPLETEHPSSRLQAICDDASPAALLCTARQRHQHAVRLSGPTIDLSQIQVQRDSSEDALPGTEPSDPAYIIYTSGSTGRPKGVVLPHRGLANLAAAQQQTFRVRADDRCLQFASLGFDASIFEILMALHAGACLHVLSKDALRSTTSETSDAIRRTRITIATLPPSLLAAIPADRLGDLRTVISAGEACSAALVKKWSAGRRFFNAYGPTEATVWATAQLCRDDGSDPTLGLPIANVQAQILDSNLEPMPIGVPGELCLSGPGLALEYNRMPDATADCFVPNPFDDRFDATLYRTGDRARWTTDGEIEFLGRIDDQVKIDAQRIEPGEIASVMRQLPGVQDAAVAVDESAARPQLVAFYVAQQDSSTDLDADALRRVLTTHLPCSMIPQRFAALESLPLTTSGKVDLRQLLATTPTSPTAERETDPRNEIEADLANIWQQVLQLDRIGVHDNFFQLGGASLQALQAADLASRRGYVVSAEQMFQFQTIAELAAIVADDPSTRQLGDDAVDAPTETRAISVPEISETAKRQHEARSVRMVIESIGMHLPPDIVSTTQIIDGCRNGLDFPLQQMTGIETRRVAGKDEFSIDLARLAATDCLSRSRWRADDIDLLIACNISRYDGPDFSISYEPSTASKLKHLIGASSAVAFDVCNACAGFFTALSIAESKLLAGECQRVMIVSGEYITHLTNTAQAEINGFLDPRLACLTLGDAGAAVIVELTDDGSGFETLDLYTSGRHHDLCIAKVSDRSEGAIMLTDAIKASAVTLNHSVGHAHRVVQQHQWTADEVSHVIMHQTSTTTLDGAIEELNRHFGATICDAANTVNNLRHRGNTASTTHWVALMDLMRKGHIRPGDKTVFAISGSGQTIGTALYQFDDLPNRVGSEILGAVATRQPIGMPRSPYGVRIVAAVSESTVRNGERSRFSDLQVVQSAAVAAQSCLRAAGWDKRDVNVLVHAGVYRDEFLSEPAVASIVAGELQMNDDLPDESSPTTLAFDLSDSARGTLAACSVVAAMLRSGQIRRGLITAAEVENNPPEMTQRGVAELGSSIAIERTDDPSRGFGDFFFRSYPELADQIETHTAFRNGRACLIVQRAGNLDQVLLRCAVDCVAEFLSQHNRVISQFDKVLLAAPPSIDQRTAAMALGMADERIVIPTSDVSGDPFTSALALLWKSVDPKSVTDGESWLLVSVGSGVEAVCVEYQH